MRQIITTLLSILILCATESHAQDFYRRQLGFTRVKYAHDHLDSSLRRSFRERGLDFPPRAVYLRVFKDERSVELWVRSADSMALFRDYDFCGYSGTLGPKRAQGDMQVPEGFYQVTHFNPTSSYLLSLGLDYPNAADRIHTRGGNPGGDIYMHGRCVSIGCISVQDNDIREIYLLAARARAAGQQRIPVHIFPLRMTETRFAGLLNTVLEQPTLADFWTQLKAGYDAFERKHRIPTLRVDPAGRYRLEGRQR